MSRVSLDALTTMNARCTTTSASATSASTAARSSTSPCRYSVRFQPWSAGSKGRRAIPTMRATPRARAFSSASMNGLPISPVGPVTATVRPPPDRGPAASARRPGAAASALAVARGLAEAQDLADVHPIALDRRRRELKAGDDAVRVQDEPALLLDEVAAHLEAVLPREVV